MEDTSPFDFREYACEPGKFNLRNYFEQFKELLNKATSNQNNLESLNTEEEKIASELGIDMDEYYDLEQRCSISLLLSDPIDKQKEPTEKEMLDEAAKYLHTAVELKALRSCPKEYYEKLSWLRRNAEPVFEQEATSNVSMSLEDFIVVVRVLSKQRDKHLNLVPQQEYQDIMLLGSQKLKELKNLIRCMDKEKEVGTDDSAAAFIFGEAVYVDDPTDDPTQTEMNFSGAVKDMNSSKIEDLEIRLGFPYVFMHHRHCEHTIKFLQARLMTSEDVQNPGRYPLVAIRDTTIKPMVVRVGNISFDTTTTIIWNLLSTAGKISWITVNVLKDNPNEKAGLVNFENEEDAKRAVSILHLYTVNGEQQWTVEHVDETTCWDEFVETEYVFETPASSACLNTTE